MARHFGLAALGRAGSGASPVPADSINASNANTVTITGYTGPGGAVTIPTNINRLLVTSISNAFRSYTA